MTDRNAQSLINNILYACILLAFVLLTSGCQENSGQPKAADTSENRLDGETQDQEQITEAVKRPTLRWEAPAAREDGSRLYSDDIKEYRIYYRLRHQNSFKAITRSARKGTAFNLNRFKPGAYEFSVTVVDRDGRESRRSDGVVVDLI